MALLAGVGVLERLEVASQEAAAQRRRMPTTAANLEVLCRGCHIDAHRRPLTDGRAGLALIWWPRCADPQPWWHILLRCVQPWWLTGCREVLRRGWYRSRP